MEYGRSIKERPCDGSNNNRAGSKSNMANILYHSEIITKVFVQAKFRNIIIDLITSSAQTRTKEKYKIIVVAVWSYSCYNVFLFIYR
jgi:ammonia channel protein AmtB